MSAKKKAKPRVRKPAREKDPPGRYSKVTRRMWLDAKFLALSAPAPNGQTLWQRLLTGPELTVLPGLFVIGEMAFAEALGWPLEDVREGVAGHVQQGFRAIWQEIANLGLAKSDWKARVVFVPNAIRHNRPESPNVVRSWRVAWDEIPVCLLKVEAYQELRAFCYRLGEGYAKAFDDTCAHPFAKVSTKVSADVSPNQEQEQEQELKRERTPRAPAPKSEPNPELKRDREPPSMPAPPSSPRLRDLGTRRIESTFLVSAYERAVLVGAGQRYAVPRDQIPVLDDAVDGHAPTPNLGERTTWLADAVVQFAAQVDPEAKRFRGGYSPKGFLQWLNDGGLLQSPIEPESHDDNPDDKGGPLLTDEERLRIVAAVEHIFDDEVRDVR